MRVSSTAAASLQRFRDKDFAFSEASPDGATLIAKAPGYEPATVDATGTSLVKIALQPLAIEGLSGVVVFPKAVGTSIDMPAQLLGQNGRVLSEFPAVELAARLIIAAADGSPLGYLDLTPRIDYSGPEIAIGLSAERTDIERVAGPSAALFLVSVKAGESVVASRPFALPQEAPPANPSP